MTRTACPSRFVTSRTASVPPQRLTFVLQTADGSFCILTRAFRSLLRSGSFAHGKGDGGQGGQPRRNNRARLVRKKTTGCILLSSAGSKMGIPVPYNTEFPELLIAKPLPQAGFRELLGRAVPVLSTPRVSIASGFSSPSIFLARLSTLILMRIISTVISKTSMPPRSKMFRSSMNSTIRPTTRSWPW